MDWSRAALPLPLLVALGGPLHAQRPTADDYLHHLPPAPRIMGQTAATARLALYGDPGDPGYRDASPRDGVDDARAERLLLLAERFSPILRRNTDHVPREVEALLGDPVRLHVDTWLDGVRTASSVVELGPRGGPLPAEADGQGSSAYAGAVAPDDRRLDSLLVALVPHFPRTGVRPPEGESETVLYLDLAGEDEASWRRAHRREPRGSRIYVHPFLHEAGGEAGERRYELVLQYWFFYPYNDGANNHEGDWEHLNVSVTTAARAAEHAGADHPHGLLSEADVAAILGPADPLPLDSLAVRTVAYYFHNNVMVLDYLAVAAGEHVVSHAKSADGAAHVWEDTSYMEVAVRRRQALAGGRLATHPIGYIGGNNKGMDELLQLRPRFLASFNRDSHGTYPFPGVWRKVGPLDATEKIFGDVVPALHLDASGEPDPSREWHELIADERYLTYPRESLVLLPDWERLLPLMLEEPALRRRWAWFVLPVHLGFPAVPSPGAGALRRVDLGNVAPMGPAFNSAWNRPGVTAVYREYTPSVLRVALAPISPLASLQSGWGILNYPLVLWGLMPGGNVAVTQVLPWATGAMHVLGAPPAKTFFLGELPTRFTSVGAGVYRQFGGRDFARLLPGPGDSTVAGLLEGAGPGARPGARARTEQWGTRLWLNLYYGSRVSIENTLSLGTAGVSYPIEDAAGREVSRVSGTLETRELTGGLTYRLPPARSDVLRLYARGGYAWTDYSVDGLRVGGERREGPQDGGYMLSLLPSRRWWPNTAYAGLGIEAFSPPRHWLLRRLGYGARVELSGLLHRLDADGACDDCHVTAERGDLAFLLLFAW